MKAITHNIDHSVWRDLMLKSGMLALMDAQARDEWYKNLEEGELPEISENNILSTFEHLHRSKGEVLEWGAGQCVCLNSLFWSHLELIPALLELGFLILAVGVGKGVLEITGE